MPAEEPACQVLTKREEKRQIKDHYTKSDLMSALAKLKEPHPRERLAEIIVDTIRGRNAAPLKMNDTEPMRFTLLGAELLIETLTEEMDGQDARTALTNRLAEMCKKALHNIPDPLEELERALQEDAATRTR